MYTEVREGRGYMILFKLSLLLLVVGIEVGIHPCLFLGTDVKELLSPRAKLNPVALRPCLSRLGLCLTSTDNNLFMILCYLSLLG